MDKNTRTTAIKKNWKYPLVRDTISQDDLAAVAQWLGETPQLTIGPLVSEFQKLWNEWQGCNHSVFVNSGSSANLLMLYTLIESGRLSPGSTVIVPAVSWVTTVSPVIQLGMQPVLCDCDSLNLGLDLAHFEKLCREIQPAAVILVHVLGVPNEMAAIMEICDRYNVMILEDCCEAHGSEYDDRKVGNFGLMSTYSYYFGHHMSTIEGGMVCTDDPDLAELCKSIRSHGWDRDLSEENRNGLRQQFDIDAFSALYTFYYAGFNLRPTELNAFLGIRQLSRLTETTRIRNEVYTHFCRLFTDCWHMSNNAGWVSAFAFGLMSKSRQKVGEQLKSQGIETRPLVCGSIGRQPFWIKRFGTSALPNADRVHYEGLYIPCNQSMTPEDAEAIYGLTPRDLLI